MELNLLVSKWKSRRGLVKVLITAIGVFKVNVKAEINITPSMRTFSLISSLDPDFQASVSLSGFEKIYYNYGDSYKDIQDELQALLTLITDINGIVLMKWGIKYWMNMERVLALIIRGLIKEHLLLCKKQYRGKCYIRSGRD